MGTTTTAVLNPLRRIAVVAGLAFSVAYGAWSFQDYRTDLEEARSHVLSVARTNAALIDAVAVFDAEFSRHDHPGGSSGATSSQLSRAYGDLGAMHHDGEIVVFRRSGDSIEPFVHRAGVDDGHDRPIALSSELGRELARALDGEQGVFVGDGADGRAQLIGYAPVPSVSWGVFVQRDLWSVQREILERALVIFGLVAAVFAATLVWIRAQIRPLLFAVEEREQRFRDFAGSASEWFWEMGPDLRFVEVFAGTRGDRGFDIKHYLGKRRADLTTEDTTTDKWRRHQDDLDNHRPFRGFEFDLRESDGEIRRIRVNGVPFYDETAGFAGYRGIGTDITEQARAAQLVREANEGARVAFENVTVACVTIDRHGAIEAFNACAETVFGYGRDEVLGRNVAMLMPASLAAQHDGWVARYLETGRRRVIGAGREAVGRRKSGEEFPIQLGVGEMRIGDTVHFIASIADLTVEKRLAEQLRRSQKMDAVGQLAGGIAHDFNNILGIVVGNLDLIRRRIDPGAPIYRQIGRATAAAERGARLTRRLLNFARQTSSAVSAIDVNDAIRDIEELLARSLMAGITMELDLDDGVWLAQTEGSEFEDALTNLVLNARDAMPSGGRLIIETSNVTVEPGQSEGMLGLAAGDYVQITVSDSGVGMSKAVLERIFEPFFTTKEATAGTGLGLPMVYGFAKRSGGNVSVYSEEGVGTTFRLYLPRSRDQRASWHADDGLQPPSELPRGTERILVVDDEADLAELAETALTGLGYSVATASNADEALRALEADPSTELLLTDIVMPGAMDGIGLAEAARARYPNLEVLLTSGFTGRHFDRQTAERWAGRLLAKPYSNLALAQAVRSILDGREP